MKISPDKLYRICNKYQWFTSGDTRQYDLLFERNKENRRSERYINERDNLIS